MGLESKQLQQDAAYLLELSNLLRHLTKEVGNIGAVMLSSSTATTIADTLYEINKRMLQDAVKLGFVPVEQNKNSGEEFAKKFIGKPFMDENGKEMGIVIDAWLDGEMVVTKVRMNSSGASRYCAQEITMVVCRVPPPIAACSDADKKSATDNPFTRFSKRLEDNLKEGDE